MPNVDVSARNAGTGATFNARTDGDGVYSIRTIPIVGYDLSAEASGFQKVETPGTLACRWELSQLCGQILLRD